MTPAFTPASDDSSREVLDAWNLGAADSSDDMLGDSLLAPPSKGASPSVISPSNELNGKRSSASRLLSPATSRRNPPPSGLPLHFTMRRGTPPSGLDLADSLLGPESISGLLPAGSIASDPPNAPPRPSFNVSQSKIGQVIHGYRLLTELGRGAFARVYLAEQIALGERLVALKVSRAEGDEPQTLARLQHTHIVPIHSVYDDPTTSMRLMCMPYLGGANLAQVLEAAGARPSKGDGKMSLVKALDEVSQRLQSVAGPSIRLSNPGRSREASGLSLLEQQSGPLASSRYGRDHSHDSIQSASHASTGRSSLDRFQSLWARITWKVPVDASNPPITGLDARDFDQPARQFLREANSIQAGVWIVARLAEGLEHAHAHGILHRDLKPSNILIAADGTPMLLDFNLSSPRRAKNPEEGEKAMLGGTLPYMSPEHIDAFNPEGTTLPEAVDERSDIYSLGLILFETIAGHHPFEEPPTGTPMLRVISFLSEQRQKVPSLRAAVPSAPWSLDSILRKCMDPNPQLRYARARDLSEDLNRFLDDRPLKHAFEPSLREKVAKWTRRNPRLCGTTSIALFAALLISSLGGLIGLFSNNMQNLSSRLKLQVFQHELDESRFRLNIISGPGEHTARGVALAKRNLEAMEVNKDGKLRGSSWVLRLTAQEQRRVRQDTAELIFLLARAQVDLSSRSGTEGDRASALKEAIHWLNAAERLDSEPPRALYTVRARYQAALGQAALAAIDRKCEAASRPVTARDFALLGTTHLSQGDLVMAEDCLVQAVNLEPRHFWAWFALGHCRSELGRFLDASADFQCCIILEPKFAWPRMNRGLCLARVGRLGEARTCYEQALVANPGFEESWVNLSLVALELNDLPAAERAMEQAISLGASDEGKLLALAEIKGRRGDCSGGEKLFDQILREKGESASRLAARGIFRLAFDPKGALADLRRAQAIDPAHARAHYGLAMALRKESPGEALKEADLALERDPSLFDALQLRALLRARTGDLAALNDVERLTQAPTPHRLYNAACALALLVGTADQARLRSGSLEFLDRALSGGMSVEMAAKDPDLASLHSLPAFAMLISKSRKSPAAYVERSKTPAKRKK